MRHIHLLATVIVACVAVSDHAQAAPATAAPRSVAVAPGAPGSVVFTVSSAGAVTVKAQMDASMNVLLFNPAGKEVARTAGTNEAVVTYNATTADIAGGKQVFRAVVEESKGAPQTARITVTVPSGVFDKDEFSRLPEVKNMTAVAPQAVAPYVPPAPVKTVHDTIRQSVTSRKDLTKPNLAAIGAAPVRIAQNQPAPSPAPSTPTPSRRLPAVGSIVVMSVDPVSHLLVPTTCSNTINNCAVHGGDMIEVHGNGIGGDFTGATQEVHFQLLGTSNSGTDFTVTPISWAAGNVLFQVPMVAATAPGTPNQSAIIVVGTPNQPVASAPFGVRYTRKIVTDFVSFDSNHFPGSPVIYHDQATSSVLDPLIFSTRTAGVHAADPTTDELIRTNNFPWSASTSFDTVLDSRTLKNSWLVSKVDFHALTTLGSWATLVTSHEGTNDPSVRINYQIGAGSGLSYTLRIEVQGDEGSQYW